MRISKRLSKAGISYVPEILWKFFRTVSNKDLREERGEHLKGPQNSEKGIDGEDPLLASTLARYVRDIHIVYLFNEIH